MLNNYQKMIDALVETGMVMKGISMIEYINQILGLIINIAIISGICFLIYFYGKLRYLDSEIEKFHRNFEKDRDNIKGETLSFVEGSKKVLEEKKNERVAPLERERQRIISKIPFLK